MFCQVFGLLNPGKSDKLTFMSPKTQKKITLISMYDGTPTLGLFALKDLIEKSGHLVSVVDVRQGEALPFLDSFDVLLSSGGPGDPTELGMWGQAYADLIDSIRVHNQTHPDQPKRAFLICHSFQVMSHYWGLGQLVKRDVTLWGIQPQRAGKLPDDVVPVFATDDFYALESRFYQVQPTHDMQQKCDELGVVIAARDDAGALTAWQTRDGHIAATQFHPEGREADVIDLMDNRPDSPVFPINHCPPAMIDDTRQRLHLLPVMEQVLISFMTKSI